MDIRDLEEDGYCGRCLEVLLDTGSDFVDGALGFPTDFERRCNILFDGRGVLKGGFPTKDYA